ARLLLLAALIAGCSVAPQPEPTPLPSTFPMQPPQAAVAMADRYLEAWTDGDYAAMYALLAPADRERFPLDRFAAIHASFAELTRVTALDSTAGDASPVALPPEARPPDFPAPAPTPPPSASPGQPAGASPSPSPTPAPTVDPDAILPGPVPGLAVPLELTFDTERFGELALERTMHLVHGPADWQVRWTPDLLFAELGETGTLRLDRELGRRGDIVGADGVVYATTREDGVRVYPQEWLAGQAIGYVSAVTAEDLESLEATGYRAGDVVGRSGLEAGAEALLRGNPGWTLVAVAADGREETLYREEVVEGANLTITLHSDLQLAAHQALTPYATAATAAIDPLTGEVWALASAPAFNPNSMVSGATLAGEPLLPAETAQVLNFAVLGAYPAGSSFKPFTLAAALQTGVVEPTSLVSCPPTWQYSADFTVHNYQDHTLPGLVSLAEAMAFSCNTTYMPLSLQVYEANPGALLAVLEEFGFGQPTGIGHVIEEIGILPDDAWMQENLGAAFGPFEQMQLAIGQGYYLGTPLQLANAYAAIGNGGTRWVPRIVARATLPDATVVLENAPRVARQISVDPADLAYVTDTLEAVTTLSYGTGTAAFAGFGIPVAGKSGTAETGTPDPHAWFAAYAPADAPTIAVATVLPYIRLGTGGTDAAPLVRRVMAEHLY
ncbi:MAG: penicillin-binding transpeptidase domain-containing protein, partial [Candidatus Limnocylindria bacterium]